MSRLSLLSGLGAMLALGAGAMGYAATSAAQEESAPREARIPHQPGPAPVPVSAAAQPELALPVRLRLAVDSSLSAELVAAGLPRPLRNAVIDRISGEQAAAIDLIVDHRHGSHAEPLYLGVQLEDGRVRRWLGAGGSLEPMEVGTAQGLRRPLAGPVTSEPGLRFHPILRYLRLHRGTDFAAAAGTPVRAALEGRVVAADWRGGYGRTVEVAHADGSSTLYAHLSDILARPGELVGQGETVGTVGSSGLATGPHLHFEWRKGGEVLRPDFAEGAPSPVQQAELRRLLNAPFRSPLKRSSSTGNL